MFPLLLMLKLLCMQNCLATSAPSKNKGGKDVKPALQHEPQFPFNSFYSQYPPEHNFFPFALWSNILQNTNQPSGDFHKPQQFPPFPHVPYPPINIPSFLSPLYPSVPSANPNIPSFHPQSIHHSTPDNQPRKPKIEYATDNDNFHKPQHFPVFPHVAFPPLNIPSFKFPLYPHMPFPHFNHSLFPPGGLPTFAPLSNAEFPSHNNFPTLPPLPPQNNKRIKEFLKQSEILGRAINMKTNPFFKHVSNIIEKRQNRSELAQNRTHISQNLPSINMEPPPQLRHLFNTFIPKNETSDDEQTSSDEDIIGVEPHCSQGRCWCPLLHYYDSDTGRCMHQNSVYENCKNSQFKCTDGRCIEGHMRCDGFLNCLDGTDENNCTQYNCSSSQFQCGDGVCIDYYGSMCNSVLDCLDGSDEAGCDSSTNTCAENQFQCGDGSCIYKDWQCDRFPDCFDASDELNCILPNCSANQFQCADGTCIDAWRKCDYTHDCPDASDEKNCSTCRVEQYRCVNSTSVKCVPMDAKCDYREDCDDGSDEFDCLDRLKIVDYEDNANEYVYEESSNEYIGDANEYVDHFINKINDRIPRMIPVISPPPLHGLDIEACTLSGVEMGLTRYEDSWLHLKDKTLTFTAQVATPRITFKCSWWPNDVKITSMNGTLGFTTDRIVLSVKVRMKLMMCAKPEVEEIAIASMGNMKPILKIHGSASGAKSFVHVDHFKQKILEGVQENIRSFANDIEKHLKNVVKHMGDVPCIDINY